MRLAQTDPAVEKQRVVGFAGRLRHGQRGGVGEVVVVADDERVERVLGIETQLVVDRGCVPARLGRFLLGRELAAASPAQALLAGADFELDLQLAPGGQREHVLQQPHVIVLEPDFAKIVGHFQRDAVVLHAHWRATEQTKDCRCRRSAWNEVVPAPHPKFFLRKLACLFPKKPVFGHFIHLASLPHFIAPLSAAASSTELTSSQ